MPAIFPATLHRQKHSLPSPAFTEAKTPLHPSSSSRCKQTLLEEGKQISQSFKNHFSQHRSLQTSAKEAVTYDSQISGSEMSFQLLAIPAKENLGLHKRQRNNFFGFVSMWKCKRIGSREPWYGKCCLWLIYSQLAHSRTFFISVLWDPAQRACEGLMGLRLPRSLPCWPFWPAAEVASCWGHGEHLSPHGDPEAAPSHGSEKGSGQVSSMLLREEIWLRTLSVKITSPAPPLWVRESA